MRKIPGYLLLSLLIIAQGGYYLGYSWKQEEIRESVTQQLLSKIPDAQLVRLQISAVRDQLRWQEEGHEFVLNGKLYDVARITKEDGQFIIYCLEDGKEETLLRDLAKKIGTENSPGGKITIEKFQLSDWISDIASISIPACQPPRKPLIYPAYAEAISSRAGPVSSPPPDRRFYPVSSSTGYSTTCSLNSYLPVFLQGASFFNPDPMPVISSNTNLSIHPDDLLPSATIYLIHTIRYRNNCDLLYYNLPACLKPALSVFVQT
ncbi:MAG: hypothetical protein U0X40_05645 [Ferruginibacter sp.]